MKRRQLVMLGTATVFAAPLHAQRKPMARLGVLHDSRRDLVFEGMFKRLGELGWVEGRNLVIEFRTLDWELKRSSVLVDELARLKCDVILANGTPAATAVKAHTPSMPMVFIIGGDPVGLGLVASLARPGGHATGYMQGSHEIILKQLSLLRELAPAAKRIAVMFEAGNPSMMQGVHAVLAAAAGAGIVLSPIPLRDWKDVDVAIETLLREPVDGLIVMFDRITSASGWKIIQMADRMRLPAVYGSRFFIDFGAVVSYGIDWTALVKQSADYVARILDGEKPANLPVQQPPQFQLVVRMHKARILGMKIPQSVLVQATEVIE
jgi:putative tryptophan/tyrosine transport system substrate-binding protein